MRVHISIYVSLREAVSSRSLLRIKLWPPQAHLGQFKPIWANLCLLETNSRPTWGQFAPTWANLGSTWSKLGASLSQDGAENQNQQQSRENREAKILVTSPVKGNLKISDWGWGKPLKEGRKSTELMNSFPFSAKTRASLLCSLLLPLRLVTPRGGRRISVGCIRLLC